MELSKRLMALVELSQENISGPELLQENFSLKKETAVDVGCDHGYVSIYLAQKKLFEHVIAMDIRTGPLATAQRNIRIYGMQDKIETRLSDGIQKLQEGEADTLICAGMGGELVIHILEQDLHKLYSMRRLVLQPQSEIFKVRKYLREHGFAICKENMIFEDGKYYPMMLATPESQQDFSTKGRVIGNQQSYTLEDYYGPDLLQQKNEVLYEFLQKEKRVSQEILVKLDPARNAEKYKEIQDKLQRIETALKRY